MSNSKSSTIHYVKNTAWMAAAVGIVSIAAFLNQAVLFNWLGKATYDGVVMLINATSFITMLSHLGIPLATTKLIATYWRRSEAVPADQIMGASLLLTVGASAVFMIILGLGGYGLYRAGYASGWGVWLIVTPLWLLSSATSRIGSGITNGFQRTVYPATILVMTEVLRLAGLAVIHLLGPSIESVVWVYTVIAIASLVFVTLILKFFFSRVGVRPAAPRKAVVRLVMEKSVPLYVPYIVSEVSLPLLILIIGFFSLKEGEVGSFRILVAVSALVMLPIIPFVITALPKMASANTRELVQLGSRAFRLTGLYAILMMAVFFFGGHWLIQLVGRGKLSEPIHLLYLLAAARVAVALALVPDTLLRSQHTARANAVMETIRFVATIVLGAVLIWRLGALGAAIAYAICMIGGTMAQLVMVHTFLHIHLAWETLQMIIPLIVLGAGFLLGWGPLWTVALTAASTAGSYLGVGALAKVRSANRGFR